MFQILEFTESHVASVTNRTESHGDDRVPAVSIGLELTAANTILDQIDPTLREALYKAVEGQDQLPGVEPSTPVLRCNSIDRVVLPTAHEGWTLQVDDNIDESDPMTFGSVKVDKFSVEPHQGGSITLRLRCGTSDVDAERMGKLAMHNGQGIWITLTAPEKLPDAIDGTTEAFKADHPDADADATDLFAAGQGPGDDEADSEGSDPDAGDALSPDLEARVQHAIEKSNAGRETVATRGPAGSRTARGREKTKEALKAGAKAHAGTH